MKYSQKGSATLWIIIALIVIAIGGYVYHARTTQSGNGTTVVGPNTAETKAVLGTLSGLQNDIQNATSTSVCKKYEGNGDLTCVTGIAVRTKNPQLCNYFTENTNTPDNVVKNACLSEYIASTKDISACSYMSLDPSPDAAVYVKMSCPSK